MKMGTGAIFGGHRCDSHRRQASFLCRPKNRSRPHFYPRSCRRLGSTAAAARSVLKPSPKNAARRWATAPGSSTGISQTTIPRNASGPMVAVKACQPAAMPSTGGPGGLGMDVWSVWSMSGSRNPVPIGEGPSGKCRLKETFRCVVQGRDECILSGCGSPIPPPTPSISRRQHGIPSSSTDRDGAAARL